MVERNACVLALLLALAGCGEVTESSPAVEVVQRAPLQLWVEAQGQLKSNKSVPLLVPGEQWTQRQLVWMKDDGSAVEAGEVVARFSGARSQMELSKAVLDLKRNQLARAGKGDELAALEGRVEVDLAQVATDLAIAERYADADLDMFARNQILDAIQDGRFLTEKQGVLQWKRGQTSERGAAEHAVLDSQQASFQGNADRRRSELEALELRAPNAGVLVLTADWSGEKPKLGATVWSGEEFASLPDPASLEVQLSLPQLEAQGIRAGMRVQLQPLGRPEQAIEAELAWVAESPQQKGRGNPVKYISMKAPLPEGSVQRYGWVPGQAFSARIILHAAEDALSVPNIAVQADGDKRYVEVLDGDRRERREVKLGPRGPARSEVLEGLAEGERVLLGGGGASA